MAGKPDTSHSVLTTRATLLVRWIAWVQQRPKRIIAAAIVVAAISLVYSICCLGFHTDRSDLVSPSKSYYQNWKRYRDEFGESPDVVVVIEGSDRRQLVSAIETVARDLSAYPALFERLSYRVRTDKLRSKGLFQLALADLRQIRDRIEMLRPILLGGWNWLSIENVLMTTRMQLAGAAKDRPLEPTVRQMIQNTTHVLESLAFYLEKGTVYQSPWTSLMSAASQEREAAPEYFFFDDGRMVLLRVSPKDDESSFTRFERPLAALEQILRRSERIFPELTFGMTGLPVLEHDEMRAAQSSSYRSLGISIIGVSLLCAIGFASIRNPLCGVATLLLSACWALGWITLTVGHLNILSSSFLVTLIGLGIDYGVLWLSRYEVAFACAGASCGANREAAETVGPGIFTGAVTTAAAFFVSMVSGFLGLREMGWIAGSGVLLCLAASLTVLPALLVLYGSKAASKKRAHAQDAPVFPWLRRAPLTVAAGLLIVVAVLGSQIGRLRFDYNLLNLQSDDAQSVKLEKRMIEKTGTSAWFALSTADSIEEAHELKRRFEALDEVGMVVEIASMIPTRQDEKLPVIQAIHQAMEILPAKGTYPSPRSPSYSGMKGQIDAVAAFPATSLRRDRALVERLQLAATRVASACEQLADSDLSLRLTSFQSLWVSDLVDRLHKLADASTPEPVTIADLPSSLASRYYGRTGKWLLQVFAQTSVWDIGPLERFDNAVSSVDPNATGRAISTLYTLKEMKEGYATSTMLAAVVVLVAVWLDFRSLKLAALASAPLVMGCTAMLGIMAIAGLELNPANLIALPIILGAGVDYGVHIIHDFRRSEGQYELRRPIAKALAMTSSTTIVGFASLLTANHWGMTTIGLVLVIGVVCCTVMALAFLPAVLTLISRHEHPASAAIPLPEPDATVVYDAA